MVQDFVHPQDVILQFKPSRVHLGGGGGAILRHRCLANSHTMRFTPKAALPATTDNKSQPEAIANHGGSEPSGSWASTRAHDAAGFFSTRVM